MILVRFRRNHETTPEKPHKNHTEKGRNNHKLTVRHGGDTNVINHRVIDFKRNKDGINAKS